MSAYVVFKPQKWLKKPFVFNKPPSEKGQRLALRERIREAPKFSIQHLKGFFHIFHRN